MSLQLSFLGNFTVYLHGQVVERFPTARVKAMLAYLALEGEKPIQREVLSELLWPERTSSVSRGNLRKCLYRLRNCFKKEPWLEGLIQTGRHTLHFSQDLAQVDVQDFLVHLHESPDDIGALQKAVKLYQGPFMKGFFLDGSLPFEDWLHWKREHLEQEVLIALQKLTEHYETTKEYERAVYYAQKRLNIRPEQEKGNRELMRLLALNGEKEKAIAQFKRYEHTLFQELQITPDTETQQLYELICRDRLAPNAPKTQSIPRELVRFQVARKGFPNAPSSFVGRKQELEAVGNQLSNKHCRLVSILGPGGIGKTRLAIETGQLDFGTLFEDGIFFASLSGITDENGLLTVLNNVLGIKALQTSPKKKLLSFLASRKILLILDNFEQLKDSGTSFLIDLLSQSTHVKCVVSSREALNIQAEWRLLIEGLPCEGKDESAVQLFLQTVRKLSSIHTLTPEDREEIVSICKLLQGLPLAIEIAASWYRMMDLTTIRDEINQGLDFLEAPFVDLPPRHRSVRAVFEHSWKRLTPEEQQVLIQLSIFQGGFDWTAALQVTQANKHKLIALLDKSLLHQTHLHRFHIHELLRQFVSEKYTREALTRLRSNHAEYYLQLLKEQKEALMGEKAAQANAKLTEDLKNVQAAWRWGTEQAQWDSLSSALEGLARYYRNTSLFKEGLKALQSSYQSLQTSASNEHTALFQRLQTEISLFLISQAQYEEALLVLDTLLEGEEGAITAKALFHKGWVLRLQGQFPSALPTLKQALQLSEKYQDKHLQIEALFELGVVFAMSGKHNEAHPHYEQALELCRHTGDQLSLAKVLLRQSFSLMFQGRYTKAISHLEQSIEICQKTHNKQDEGRAANMMGAVMLHLGQQAALEEWHEKALRLYRQTGDLQGQGIVWHNLALASLWQEDLGKALEQAEKALHITTSIGDKFIGSGVWHILGRIYAGQGKLKKALKAYHRSIEWRRMMRRHTAGLEPLAGIARIHLDSGKLDEALACVEEIWAIMDKVEPDGLNEHFQIYLTCYDAFRQCGDSRTQEVLKKAKEIFLKRLENITDPQQRDTYQHNLPVNKRLQAFVL